MSGKTARYLLVSGLVAFLPVHAQDFSAYTGAELYKRFCASCHGATGQGDGPVASALLAKPPDLTRITARHGGKFPEPEMKRIVDGRDIRQAHGTRDMPVWGMEFSRTDVDTLVGRVVAHLRELQQP
ncbi:MAG: cytochrome c [Pseudomonadota bacterium]